MNKSSFKNKVQEFEIKLIKDALAVSKSTADAARKLGLNRTTLVEKMKRFGTRIEIPHHIDVLEWVP